MQKLIKRIVDLSYLSKEGHIASSLSVLDILFVLYTNILDLYSIKNVLIDRDRFILSKGHASLSLYAMLEYVKLLDDINDFCQFDSVLGGHPSDKINFVEASTGSLGHGLPIGIGMALSYKIQNFKHRIFVMIGDGEANEGSIWESALLAAHHKLDNIVCILDHNHSGDRALKIDNVYQKFESFGWCCVEINGHNQSEINAVLNLRSDKPIFILANTTKGKGIHIMENNPEWHHKSPNDEEYQKIMNDLNEKTINKND